MKNEILKTYQDIQEALSKNADAIKNIVYEAKELRKVLYGIENRIGSIEHHCINNTITSLYKIAKELAEQNLVFAKQSRELVELFLNR